MFPQQATPLIDDWFLAEVTVVTAGSPVTYSFFELALQGDKTVSEKLGGRVGTTANPAVAAAGGPFVVGDVIKVRLGKNAGGLYYEAIPADSSAASEPGTGSASSGCGWVAGLRETDCLTLTVLSARGRCSGIDTGQELYLFWDTDAFVSGDDAVDVPEDDFEHDGGIGPAEFWVEDGRARMTIDGVEGVMETCDPSYAVFAFGGPTLCDGEDAEACGDNTFRVKVECGCYVTLECVESYLPETGGTLPRRLWITYTDESPGGLCPELAGGPWPLDYVGGNTWEYRLAPEGWVTALQCTVVDSEDVLVVYRGLLPNLDPDEVLNQVVVSQVPLLITGSFCLSNGVSPSVCHFCAGLPAGTPPCDGGGANPIDDCRYLTFVISETPP
jgi:hypothetical protein